MNKALGREKEKQPRRAGKVTGNRIGKRNGLTEKGTDGHGKIQQNGKQQTEEDGKARKEASKEAHEEACSERK